MSSRIALCGCSVVVSLCRHDHQPCSLLLSASVLHCFLWWPAHRYKSKCLHGWNEVELTNEAWGVLGRQSQGRFYTLQWEIAANLLTVWNESGGSSIFLEVAFEAKAVLYCWPKVSLTTICLFHICIISPTWSMLVGKYLKLKPKIFFYIPAFN